MTEGMKNKLNFLVYVTRPREIEDRGDRKIDRERETERGREVIDCNQSDFGKQFG